MTGIDVFSIMNKNDPGTVFDEIREIHEVISPRYIGLICRAYIDTLKIYNGAHEGYSRGCGRGTQYHGLAHTLEVTLATSRLMHGCVLSGDNMVELSEKGIMLGVLTALMHDTGYVLADDDEEDSGAAYTRTHVVRSVEFLNGYLKNNTDFSATDLKTCDNIITCTDLPVRISDIEFSSAQEKTLASIVGTTDLVAQMANRAYLERLEYLFDEFKEAGLEAYEDFTDLLERTLEFYYFALSRIKINFGNVEVFMKDHFFGRLGIRRDLYMESAERNTAYLIEVLKKGIIESGLNRKTDSHDTNEEMIRAVEEMAEPYLS